MKRFALYVLLSLFPVSVVLSQEPLLIEPGLTGLKSGLGPRTIAPSAAITSSYRSPKRPGHFSSQDWRALIDSLWGPGPPTATKLQIFDTYWNLIDREYGGFPYLSVNWDSLKALFRPEIEAGVGRGRFWGILGQLYLPLQEIHTYIFDAALDSSFFDGQQAVYRHGIPAFFPSGWGWAGNFGAALTPLPDSSLLVYRSRAAHPLGIVPGDVVLGYDRIPWKQLYRDILSAQLPLEWWGVSRWGSSPTQHDPWTSE